VRAALANPSLAEAATLSPHEGSPTTGSDLEAGTRLKYFGDYELLDEIARGGMGVVWKARQTSLHREVALKMIRAGTLASPDEVQRFLREAEAAANLQHPNIVAIHEVGQHDGQHYFSMDYVAGRDLGDLVKDGPLPARRAAGYLKTIAEAIHFAHQRGTLHRDLKPQNVLIDAADQPRITDFGLAKIMKGDSRLTQSGVIMGSPSYMPPEQAAGRPGDIGPASDVYSLGAMLYELLTGRPPFSGATPLDTVMKVLEAEPVAPRRLHADIPIDLETICLKCLEKAPSARYPTARALAEELDRFLKGEPIQARPASSVRKVVSWTRRHPGTLAAIAALVVVVLAFGLFYLFEENAFLRAQQTDPHLTRAPGARHEFLNIFKEINMWAMIVGFFVYGFVMMRARGLPFKTWLSKANLLHTRPLQPLGEQTRAVTALVGLLITGCGIVLLAATIRAHIWEAETIRGQISGIYASTYVGLALLAIVIRDYRLVHYGISSTPNRQLSAEQIASIRRTLEQRDFDAAHQCYFEAVPDASKQEATRYVCGLWLSMVAENPDKFGPPPLSLATLNWKAMAICAAVEAPILALLWYLMAPANLGWSALQLGAGFLFGAGLMAGARVKTFWMRCVLMFPGAIVMVLALVPFRIEKVPQMLVLFIGGFICGAFLLVSGYTRGRTRSRSDGR
jgi:tRNA A-37 threonylcarbamoyl transferase component Bud32